MPQVTQHLIVSVKCLPLVPQFAKFLPYPVQCTGMKDPRSGHAHLAPQHFYIPNRKFKLEIDNSQWMVQEVEVSLEIRWNGKRVFLRKRRTDSSQ